MAYRTISAADFIKELNTKGQDGSSIVHDVEVYEIVNIDASNFQGHPIYLLRCKFYGGIYFNSIPKAQGIKIATCEMPVLSFTKVCATFSQGEYVDEGCIALFNIVVSDVLKIADCNIDRYISIVEKSEIKDIIVSQTTSNRILFENSTIAHNLQVMQCQFDTELRINTSKILSRTIIAQTSSNGLVFDRSTHTTSIEIAGGEIKEKIHFFKAIIEGEVTVVGIKTVLDKSKPISSIYFIDSVFKKSCEILYKEDTPMYGFQYIAIRSTDFQNGLNIKGRNTTGELPIIDDVRIDCSRQLKGEISFSNIVIKHIYINGINADTSIIFNSILLKTIDVHNFNNSGNIQYFNVKLIEPDLSRFHIENSALGNAQFSSTDLSAFHEIAIKNSNLTEISASSVKWFRYEKLNSDDSTSDGYRQKREVFRQLKFAMEKQGDRIQALVFKQYEMIAYRHELQKTGKWWNKFDEKFIMWLNRSNSYGQNWWKPVLWALGVTVLFYYLITIMQSPQISGIEISVIGATRLGKTLSDNFGIFFEMLNPAHNIDKLKEGSKEIYRITYFLDYFYRIILTYLIYQTISAFRKYVK